MVLVPLGGKLEIITGKGSYYPSELVQGKLVLNLKRPMNANSLHIHFYGQVKTTERGGARKTWKIFEQELVLDGTKEYPAGNSEYGFSFHIPSFGKAGAESSLMQKMADAAMSYGANPQDARWFLNASLDIPFSLDLSKKIEIKII